MVLKVWDDCMETRPCWDQELGPWLLMKRARRILTFFPRYAAMADDMMTSSSSVISGSLCMGSGMVASIGIWLKRNQAMFFLGPEFPFGVEKIE